MWKHLWTTYAVLELYPLGNSSGRTFVLFHVLYSGICVSACANTQLHIALPMTYVKPILLSSSFFDAPGSEPAVVETTEPKFSVAGSPRDEFPSHF